MKYYSTNDHRLRVDLKQAVWDGLAPDGGLFLPEVLPLMPQFFFDSIEGKSFVDISFEVATALIGDNLPADILYDMIEETLQFEAPLFQVGNNLHVLELFHGPTLAFKDFGARFMSRLLGHYASEESHTSILVATSGDTGSAVAHGFLDVPNTEVFVLYPSGLVSEIQEKQFATLGKNITALKVRGTFDDCQKMVKQAFSDRNLRNRIQLTSANSINLARLIPQTFYYFHAYAQLKVKDKPIVFAVPSGNLGNLTAGLIAKRMGLPIHQFVAATNRNDVLPEYLQTGRFRPRPSIPTISNAMDVGDPSNFARVLELYKENIKALKDDLVGFSFTDDETRTAIRKVFKEQNYLLDPHGAVGYLGISKYLSAHPDTVGVFLETAHPGKFKSVVEEAIHQPVELPTRLQQFLERDKKSVEMSNDYEMLKEILLKNER
jgi:threonine synthase